MLSPGPPATLECYLWPRRAPAPFHPRPDDLGIESDIVTDFHELDAPLCH
jgi:hypothetical protein